MPTEVRTRSVTTLLMYVLPSLFTRHTLISINGDWVKCTLVLTDKGLASFNWRDVKSVADINFNYIVTDNKIVFTLKDLE